MLIYSPLCITSMYLHGLRTRNAVIKLPNSYPWTAFKSPFDTYEERIASALARNTTLSVQHVIIILP
jgi:hypothetical protein